MPPDIPRVVAQSTDDPDQFSELLLAVSPELDISPTGKRFRASAKLAPLERINLFLPRLINARVRKQAILEEHTLAPVLPEWRLPTVSLSVLYAPRLLPRAVRVSVEHLRGEFAEYQSAFDAAVH